MTLGVGQIIRNMMIGEGVEVKASTDQYGRRGGLRPAQEITLEPRALEKSINMKSRRCYVTAAFYRNTAEGPVYAIFKKQHGIPAGTTMRVLSKHLKDPEIKARTIKGAVSLQQALRQVLRTESSC